MSENAAKDLLRLLAGDPYYEPELAPRKLAHATAALAAAEERGRRSGVEEAATKLRMTYWELVPAVPASAPIFDFAVAAEAAIRALAPRDSGKEPDFLAAMDEVRDDLKRKGVRVNTVELLTELYEGRGHSHEEALRMARGEPDSEDRK